MNRRSITLGALVLVLLGGLFACRGGESGSEEGTAMEEYVVGEKRYAGTWQREVEASRKPSRDLGPPDVSIEIKAAIAGWDPKEFTVKKGQVVELVLIGTDNGQLPALTGVKEFSGHGFHCYGYDIWVGGLRAGVERKIKFEASRAGKFVYECSVFCSTDHYKMNGRMIVTE